ncbi:MAG: hypothetical protein HY046_02245 [Acidobacteria bacterium]|nr:hypothetical protein [Acidobacteriota bacterium]
MPLRLKTKFTLTTALLVLGVSALNSVRDVSRLVAGTVDQARERAEFVSQQVFFHAQQALKDAAEAGQAPATAEPDDVRTYVRQALEQSAGLTSMIDASIGYSPLIYEVTIVDHKSVALISSDSSLPGQTKARRLPMSQLTTAGFVGQLRIIFGPPQVHELVLPFNLGPQPFGEIRVAIATALLRNQIEPVLREAGRNVLLVVVFSTLLAGAVSHFSLRPLAKISAQLDRIAKGEVAPAAIDTPDELGQVSMMAGIDDGLILFTGEGRAALVSPAVEKFLGAAPQALTGKGVNEIFPESHPLRKALQIHGGKLIPVAPVEVHLNGATGAASRAIASVQMIHAPEGTESIGALLTLRDVESIEKIGSQLEVSERLAALGRVTAGVAHEVKNPLNSMRLWLENLKQSIPARAGEGSPMAQQAVKILDSEIDRLDRVVKTFLDFSRPVDLDLKPTDVCELLRDVASVARPQFESARVQLTLAGATTPIRVLADAQLLKQAVLNLTLNALEAIRSVPQRTDPGRVTLGCKRLLNSVVVRVEDNGPGVAPENRAKIFQLYFTTRPGGSGIGLATAFRIAQLHNGSIDFESELGLGTTFRIELPLAEG